MRVRRHLRGAILAWLLAVPLCLGASPGGAANGGANMDLVIVNDSGVFNLYTGSSLESLLGSTQTTQAQYNYSLAPAGDSGVTPTASYSDLGKLLGEHKVDVWYIASQQALLGLSDGQNGQLRAAAQKGAVIGYAGEGKLLMDELDLQGKSRYTDIPDDVRVSYFANVTLDSVMEGYTLETEGVPLGDAWTGVMSWAYSQIGVPASAGAAKAEDSSPWDALYNEQFNDSKGGLSNSLTVSIYKLESSSATNDWYRVDMILQGSTQIYQGGWFKEWGASFEVMDYIKTMTASVQAERSDIKLIEHAPSTTLSNTSASFTLGASAELAKEPKIGGEVGYTKSYDCPDITMYDYTSVADGMGKWTAAPKGPDLTFWPVYWAEPALAARTSYSYEPTMIFKTTKGSELDLLVEGKTTFEEFKKYVLVDWWDTPARDSWQRIILHY